MSDEGKEESKRQHEAAGTDRRYTSPLQAMCKHCHRWFYCDDFGAALNRAGDVDCAAAGPRYFFSPGYLKLLEPGLYGLFRDTLVEDPKTGGREKVGKPVGPIRILRPRLPDEDERLVRLRTVHPQTGQALELVEVKL